MILKLAPAGELFDKIVNDFKINSHEINIPTWTRWMMEAMQHIGGINKIAGCNSSVSLKITNYRTKYLNPWMIHINEVLYNSKTEKDVPLTDFEPAIRSNFDFFSETEYLNPNFAENQRVYYYLDHVMDKKNLNSELGLRCCMCFSRENGRTWIRYLKLPVLSGISAESGRTCTFIPSLPLYQEAIMWYIIYKIYNLAFFKDPKKGPQLQHAQNMWRQLRLSAYGEVMMPDSWELEELADVLSLNVSYTGLSSARDNRHNPDTGGHVGTSKNGVPVDPSSAFRANYGRVVNVGDID